jgi:hypothetical protein
MMRMRAPIGELKFFSTCACVKIEGFDSLLPLALIKGARTSKYAAFFARILLVAVRNGLQSLAA